MEPLRRSSTSYEGNFELILVTHIGYGLRTGIELYEIEFPVVPQ